MEGISVKWVALAESDGERTVGALRNARDMRLVVPRGRRIIGLAATHDAHNMRGRNRPNATQMATFTVVIGTTRIAALVTSRFDLRTVMNVLVTPGICV